MQQGPLAPQALPCFLATTDLAATASPSIAFPVVPVIQSTFLHRFPGGARTASPVAWHVLVTVLSLPPRRSEMTLQPACRHLMLPSPRTKGFGLRVYFCRGHHWVHLRYGPVTHSPSPGRLCQLASSISFPSQMQLKLQGSDFYPGGTDPH